MHKYQYRYMYMYSCTIHVNIGGLDSNAGQRDEARQGNYVEDRVLLHGKDELPQVGLEPTTYCTCIY